MKKLTKFLVLVLSALLLISSTACSGEQGNGGTNTKDVPYKATSYKLVKDGKSDYVIVYEETDDYFLNFAVSEFQSIFYEATGVMLNTVSENDPSVVYNENSKYISIGKTNILKTVGLENAYSESVMGQSGRIMKVVGQSLFIDGGPHGAARAVYDFMNYQFGYEFFAVDEVYIEKTEDDVYLLNYDYSVKPDIEINIMSYGEIGGEATTKNPLTMRYRLVPMYDAVFPPANTGGTWHNILGIVNPNSVDPYHEGDPEKEGKTFKDNHPSWFSNGQLNFSAQESREELIGRVIESWQSNLDKYYNENGPEHYKSSGHEVVWTFTPMDTGTWSTSDETKESLKKYGANSAEYIMFMNECAEGIKDDQGEWVVRGMNDWMEENYPDARFHYAMFAYQAGTEPPILKNEAGEPILDENGNYQPIHVKVVKTDENGDPVHIMTPKKDKDGNPVLDEHGEQVYIDEGFEYVDETVVLKDENGNPILDGNGNVQYVDSGRYVMLNERVILFYAPIRQSFYHALPETENQYYVDLYDQWRACMQPDAEGMVWLYCANFEQYFVPLDAMQGMQEDYQWANSRDITFYFLECGLQEKVGGDWKRLNMYMGGKLGEDVNLDYTYETERFMKQYFKDAAEPMTKFHDEYRNWFAHLAEETDLSFFYVTEDKQVAKENWPYAMLMQWLRYADEAYKTIAHYETEDHDMYIKLRDRINLETLTIRYVLLKDYPARLENKTEFATELLNDCIYLGWTMARSGTSTTDFLKSFLN